MFLRRTRVDGHSFAAALAQVSRVFTPPAHAAQNLGVDLRRSCREQTSSGMLGATARLAPARPVTPPEGSATKVWRDCFS